jgi:hypothetical protein
MVRDYKIVNGGGGMHSRAFYSALLGGSSCMSMRNKCIPIKLTKKNTKRFWQFVQCFYCFDGTVPDGWNPLKKHPHSQ